MSKSEVRLIANSYSVSSGIQISTLSIVMPRVILAQFNTHRMFSRSAQSSRAIPVKKLLREVYRNPYVPQFRENEKGMQSSVTITGIRAKLAKFLWLTAKNFAVTVAWLFSKLNITKEIANRVLEPFSYVTVVVTSTEWDNFFALRAHPDAQADIDQIAVMIRDILKYAKPNILRVGDWHLPFIQGHECEPFSNNSIEDLLKMSTARCARVSYLNHDKERPSKEEDFALYDRLITQKPMHASPCEHQATPMMYPNWSDTPCSGITHISMRGQMQPWSGNFRGWVQHRQIIESATNAK